MLQAATQRAEYRFTIITRGDGVPWIHLDPARNPGLAILEDGMLGFNLPEGTSEERAQEIARFLNEHLVEVIHTRFPKFPTDSVDVIYR